MPIVEIQAIIKNYDGGEGETPRERLIAYEEWIKDLRIPLAGRRLAIVKQSYAQIAAGNQTEITVGQAREAFAFD